MSGEHDQSKTKYHVTDEVKNSVLCKVLMLDGTDFKVHIHKNAIGQVLFLKSCEHLSLLEKEYFSITFKEANGTKVWLQHDKPIAKQLNKLKWEFSFEVKFYPQDPCNLKEELTRYQMYLQVRVDILAGRLLCSHHANAILGGYACQSQLGDWDPNEHDQGFEYVKNLKFCPGQTDDLIEAIAEQHKDNHGMEAAEAEYRYLENVRTMSLYGVHMINARDEDHRQVSLGICADGLLVFMERIRLHRYVWAKIMKIAYKRNKFTIHVRPDSPKEPIPLVVYHLLNYKTAKRTWRLAVEHHMFFRYLFIDVFV
ncbi:hypothetical protein HELRODRAFT_66975 [Helobdella robusta]|uniref:FERM domain-containing protein n=1 Tax=Helobdella robusta TaxID=6412 RepID=T1FYU4_HELRO|nr:hypothetical protein HELRODRAFT_66975 [Helobdella robusta]ESN98921.1 hypothetical protein HELRODRAFT_66975 [Helobdella robusta]